MAVANTRGAHTASTVDDAFIALLIAAMDASGHVSPQEAERAHHIIWSMRRFHHRSGDVVGRKIEKMRSRIERLGSRAVLEASAKQIPPRLRPAAFAIAADLILVDGRLEPLERRFLTDLAGDLRLRPDVSGRILDVMRVKNRA